MKENRSYQLNIGTILDERYEIGKVLGEGGFGITYAGQNIRSGRRVAIKEFFCRDYMDRDEDGVSTVVTYKSAERRFNSERVKFMREARILREFEDEDAIVTVLDYFEAGGTAYLVMEYIEGETLHEYVKRCGAYKPEQFFEEIRPLLSSLSKVHEAGVIHRDISPDNIMRMSDGRPVLIDFGSAKDFTGKTVTTATTYKDGFAPIEQYVKGKEMGPETDIYSLAATFYYCLTGSRPESSIQRSLVDELRPMHELASGIPEEIEEMINKGMSVLQRDRYQSIADMEEVIERYYPLLTPEEKAGIRKRKRIRNSLIAAVCLIAVALVGVHIYRNSAEYRMKVQPTQKAYLNWKELTDEEKEESLETIRNRLTVFAGKNNFMLTDSKDENETVVEIPISVIQDNKLDELLRKYITRPFDSFQITYAGEYMAPAYTTKEDDKYVELPYIERTREDVSDVVAGEGSVPVSDTLDADMPYLKISFIIPDEMRGFTAQLLEDKGPRMFVVTAEDSKDYYFPAFSAGDGRSIYIIPQESVDAGEFKDVWNTDLQQTNSEKYAVQETGGNYRETIKYILESKSVSYSPGVRAEPRIEWESVEGNILAGDNQINESEMNGDTLVAEYTCSSESVSDPEWLNMIMTVKNRLDILEIPYSFGMFPCDDRRLAFKIEKGKISQAELLVLGVDAYFLRLSDRLDEETASIENINYYDGDNTENTFISVNEDSISDYEYKKYEELTSTFRERNEESVWLCMGYGGSYPIGSVKTSDISKKNIKNGSIPFSMTFPGVEESAEKKKIICNYVNFIMAERMPNGKALTLDRISSADKKHEYVEDIAIYDIEGAFFPEEIQLAKTINNDIKKSKPNGSGVKLDYIESGNYSIDIVDNSLPDDSPEKAAVKIAEYYIQKYKLLENGITFSIEIVNKSDKNSKNDDKSKSYRFYFSFPKKALDKQSSDYKPSLSTIVWVDHEQDMTLTEESREILTKEISKSIILKGQIE